MYYSKEVGMLFEMLVIIECSDVLHPAPSKPHIKLIIRSVLDLVPAACFKNAGPPGSAIKRPLVEHLTAN